jgi:hypothetical protein
MRQGDIQSIPGGVNPLQGATQHLHRTAFGAVQVRPSPSSRTISHREGAKGSKILKEEV